MCGEVGEKAGRAGEKSGGKTLRVICTPTREALSVRVVLQKKIKRTTSAVANDVIATPNIARSGNT